MTEPLQSDPGRETPTEVLAYLKEEQARRCEAVRVEARERIQEIEAACRDQKEQILNEGRRALPALRRSVTISVAGPARREAEAVASHKMGDAGERIMAGCHDRLRELADTSVFSAVLESLVCEVVEGAMQLQRVSQASEIRGRLHAGPNDASACQRIVARNGASNSR